MTAASSSTANGGANGHGAKADLPVAVDLSHHLSTLARSRMPSPLKDIIQFMSLDNMISLAGGLPHPSLFPFHSLSTSIFPPSTVMDPEAPAAPSEAIDISIGRTADADSPFKSAGDSPFSISAHLQYSGGRGLIPMETWCRNLTKRLTPPAYADWEVLINCGGTDAWTKCCTLLLESGDTILTEGQVYPSAQATWVPMGVRAVPIPCDSQGMRPDILDQTLSNWDDNDPRGRKPRLAYLVPVGQNPLGSTMGQERRQAIYDLAVKHDIVIVEDDPYNALQFEPFEFGQPVAPPATEVDGAAFFAGMSQSFLRIDVQGRVIRLDTFSKVLAPGARIGWFVANKMFIERLLRGTEVQNQQPSGFSQMIIGEVLNKWGIDGYLEWCTNLKEQYRVRRDWMLETLADEFDLVPASESDVPGAIGMVAYPKGQAKTGPALMSFVPPVGGMFVWCTVYYNTHPEFAAFSETSKAPEREFENVFWRKLVDSRVLVTPGFYFTPFEGEGVAPAHPEPGCGHFRLAYSFEPKEAMVEGLRRLARVMHAEWGQEVQA